MRKGIKPEIAGRNLEKIKQLGLENDLAYEAFDLSEKDKLHAWLEKGKLVIHCGGPFIHTAQVMVEACLMSKNFMQMQNTLPAITTDNTSKRIRFK